MSAGETRLWLLQRATALILAPLVIVHLGLIVYAVQGGLSAEEILARTRGSAGWAGFYGLFVLAAAIHGSIGLRGVLREATPLSRGSVALIAIGFALLLIALGLRAVYAVVAA